jgi:twitching motility protein PilU
LIFKGDVHEIKEQMKKSRNLGMQTLDQALFDLYEANQISYEDTVRFADSQSEVKLAIRLQSRRAQKNQPAISPASYPSIDPISGGR